MSTNVSNRFWFEAVEEKEKRGRLQCYGCQNARGWNKQLIRLVSRIHEERTRVLTKNYTPNAIQSDDGGF